MQTGPTLALISGRIWTGNPSQPWAEALLAAGDRITFVGSTSDIRARSGSARVIDARGHFVTPGFFDSHVHFVNGGQRLSSVQLRDANTREEFVNRIKAFAATLPKGAWLTGGDWDHTVWGGELPDRRWIDFVTPDNPVWINRLDGHMSLANTLALRAATVNRDTPTPSGGEIVHDAEGEPTGVLKDNAKMLVGRVIPATPDALLDRAVVAACAHVAQRGITSVHHMGDWDDLQTMRRAHRAGTLKTRVYANVPLHTWPDLRDFIAGNGRGDAMLHWGGLKGYVDGSLGSHTAAMLEGFTDAPKETGLLVNSRESLYNWTTGASGAGLQVMVHAIGDRAIRIQLDNFEQATRDHALRDPRFRIEHAQHISPADIPRFGAIGVIASMQPYHCIDDGRWAEKVIGPERAKTSYAFRSLLGTRSKLAFGSDWYVAPPTPIEGIYAAVTRRTLDGKHPDGWVPQEKITVEEALVAYTRGAAYAEFAERDKGTLEPGKLCDFVVIDRNLTKIAPETLNQAQVVETVLGGRSIYTRT